MLHLSNKIEVLEAIMANKGILERAWAIYLDEMAKKDDLRQVIFTLHSKLSDHNCFLKTLGKSRLFDELIDMRFRMNARMDDIEQLAQFFDELDHKT